MMTQELIMPKMYQEISEAEMMTLEGGIDTRTHWWGLEEIMSAQESRDYQYKLHQVAIGQLTVGALAGVESVGVATIVTGLGASYATALANSLGKNTTERGVKLDLTWALIYSTEGR
ncbi:MAG: hypothetical protein ACRC6X_01150 [Culicoidibacterales bacterium]